MLKVQNNSSLNSSKTMTKKNQRLNANAGLTQEETEVLHSAAEQLTSISQSLATLIGDQVADPTYVDGKSAAADRLLEWTADIFALSEDIRFYLNPPPEG